MTQPQSMVETVARAMFAKAGHKIAWNSAGSFFATQGRGSLRDFYIGCARAAIDAMREPDNAMMIAMLQAALDWMKQNGVTALSPFADYPSPAETTRICWSAGIDAALAEQSPAENGPVRGEGA
jgi:hypothetical protein